MEGTIQHRGSLLDEALRALFRMKSDERKTPMAPRPFQLTQGCGIIEDPYYVNATRKPSRQEEERRGALTKISDDMVITVFVCVSRVCDSMTFPFEKKLREEKERRREIMKAMFAYKTPDCTSEKGLLSGRGGSMMFPEEHRIEEKERRPEKMKLMLACEIPIVADFTMDHTPYLEKLGKDTTRDEFRLNYPAINRSKDVQAMQAYSRIMSKIKAEFHNWKKLENGNWKLEELRTPYVVSWWKGNKEPLIKYFGRHSMETENEEDGQNPEIRNAVISDKAGPTELEMFTAERYRQSEQLRLKNDKQMMEIEEALQRILHHLQMQTKGEKRRRCHASA